jgi:hypothetical protein
MKCAWQSVARPCASEDADNGSGRLLVIVYKQLPLKIFRGVCGGFKKVPTFTRELTQKSFFVFSG